MGSLKLGEVITLAVKSSQGINTGANRKKIGGWLMPGQWDLTKKGEQGNLGEVIELIPYLVS